jgi:hypothetical protein
LAGFFYISVVGNLERIDENSTRVIGQGRISPVIYLLMVILALPLFFVFFTTGFTEQYLATIILPLIGIVILWASSLSTRDYLMKLLYETLHTD